MKKALTFVLAALAVFAFAKPKGPSRAQQAKNEKMDKANWGGVDYSAAPDGENSVANDLAQIRSMVRGEAATMKKLFDFCNSLLHGANIVDMEPETVLGDALKQLGRPIDPTPPRMLTNLSATPAQKLGFKSLQGAKSTVGKFGKDVRPKMSSLLKTEIEARVYSDYNRLVRVTSQSIIKDGSLVTSLRKVDTAWAKYLKILDQISKGTDKWKYYPAQLRNPEIRKKQREMEENWVNKAVPELDKRVFAIKGKEAQVKELTRFSCNQANKMTQSWKRFYHDLFMKYMDGNVNMPGTPVKGQKYVPIDSKHPKYSDEYYEILIEKTGDKYKAY